MPIKSKTHSNISIRADTSKILKKFYRFETKDVNQDTRTLDVSFASEQPYDRWFGPEILQCDNEAVDLDRFNNGLGTVLFNHNRDYVIGHIEKAYNDDKKHTCRAVIKFDEDDASDMIFQKVQSGTLQGISVGYVVNKYTQLYDDKQTSANGRFTGPAYVAMRWTPMEISIVSVPADDSVGIGRSFEPEDLRTLENLLSNLVDKTGGKKMNYNAMSVEQLLVALRTAADDAVRTEIETAIRSKLAQSQAHTVLPPVTTPTLTDDDITKARDAETERITNIMALCRQFDTKPDDFIEKKSSINDVRTAILEQLIKAKAPVNPGVSVGEEEIDKFKAAAADAIIMRAGIRTSDKPASGATELRYMRLTDLAHECLVRSGVTDATYEPLALTRAAITGTDAFPNILADVAHKVMDNAYNEQAVTYPLFTRKGSNVDFKPANRVQLSDAELLEKIPEHGVYKHAEIKDSGLAITLATFGRKFSLTRKAIINDDLSALTMIPRLFGLAARRGINEDVYDLLNNNAKAPDSKALFHADHKNIAPAADIAVEAIGAMKALMMRQKRGSVVLNIIPTIMVVPPEKETTASQIVASTVDPSKANATPNPYANKLMVVTDGYLTDAKAWYMFGDPNLCNTIEVTYLNGVETPYLESRQGFDVDGMEFKIRHDYAVSILDYRAIMKNPGI